MQNDHKGFQNVSQAADPAFFFRFLDAADALPPIQRCKQRMRELLQPQPGQRLMDVGCGIGHEVQRLAQQVGSHGCVVGIDHSAQMIDEARRRADAQQLPVEYYVRDAHALSFPDASFDGCRAERVFLYLEQPGVALAEMVRVTRPGGRVVIFDFDYEATIVDTPERELTRRLVRFVTDWLPNGWIGRQLPRRCAEAGLVEVTAEPFTIVTPYPMFQNVWRGSFDTAVAQGVLSAEELAGWWQELATAQQQGRFFATVQGFIISGCAPMSAAPDRSGEDA